jgi:hypothetical protein
MKIKLRRTVEDNHGNTFVAWIDEKGDKSTLNLEEKTGSTHGRWDWYISTLMGKDKWSSGPIQDKLYLDFGQDWYVAGMKDLMKEVEDVLERRGIEITSATRGVISAIVAGREPRSTWPVPGARCTRHGTTGTRRSQFDDDLSSPNGLGNMKPTLTRRPQQWSRTSSPAACTSDT